ncbi:hypothetical protein J6590_100549, partial [Homalodisca vitripennis]
ISESSTAKERLKSAVCLMFQEPPPSPSYPLLPHPSPLLPHFYPPILLNNPPLCSTSLLNKVI